MSGGDVKCSLAGSAGNGSGRCGEWPGHPGVVPGRHGRGRSHVGVGGGGGHRVGVAVSTPASNHRTPVKPPTERQQVVLKFCDKNEWKKPRSNFDFETSRFISWKCTPLCRSQFSFSYIRRAVVGWELYVLFHAKIMFRSFGGILQFRNTWDPLFDILDEAVRWLLARPLPVPTCRTSWLRAAMPGFETIEQPQSISIWKQPDQSHEYNIGYTFYCLTFKYVAWLSKLNFEH